jgi:hypothetical protein
MDAYDRFGSAWSEMVGFNKSLIADWKLNPYSEDGRRLERTYQRALGVEGDVRNDSLTSNEPSDEIVEAAGRVSEFSRGYIRDRLLESPDPTTEDPMDMSLHRGIGRYATEELWARAFGSDSSETVALPGNALDNWTTSSDAADRFADQKQSLSVRTEVNVDEIAAAHDVVRNSGFASENEILIPSDDREVSTDGVRVHGSDLTARQVLEGDVDTDPETEENLQASSAIEQIAMSIQNDPDSWSDDALDRVESWVEEQDFANTTQRDIVRDAVAEARSSRETEVEPIIKATTRQGKSFDYESWEDDFNIRNASEGRSLSAEGAAQGASSLSMEVVTAPNGDTAFVKYYQDNDGLSLTDVLGESGFDSFNKTMAAYETTKLLGGSVPPHYGERGDDGFAQYHASKGVEGEEVVNAFGLKKTPDGPEVTSGEEYRDSLDIETWVNEGAIQLLAGNSDLHSKNFIVDKEGGVYPIDLDHAANSMYDPDMPNEYDRFANTSSQFASLVSVVDDNYSAEEIQRMLMQRAMEIASEAVDNEQFMERLIDALEEYDTSAMEAILDNFEFFSQLDDPEEVLES